MTNKKDKTSERVAQLERELAALKAKVDPPKSTFVPMTDGEHANWLYQLREGRMSMAMHPSVIRDMAGGVSAADCAGIIKASHAPTGPSPMTPRSAPTDTPVRRNVPGSGTGWGYSAPLRHFGVAQDDSKKSEKPKAVKESK
jgi:hypothetical protein